MAKKKKFSKEEIEKLNKVALERLEEIEVRKGRKSQKEDFLIEIKEVIQKALDKKIPFTQISKLIKELYSIDISPNILRVFAKNHLGYTATRKKQANDTTKNKDNSDAGSSRKKANISDI
jgi:hypothetical protein